MKLLILLFLSVVLNIAYADMYLVNPKGLSEKQLVNFNNHLLRVHKILPKSYSKIKEVNISFKKIKKSQSGSHLGHYSSWYNEIVFNKDIIPETGFSIALEKTIIHELAHVYEDKVKSIHDDLKYLYLAGWHKRGLFFKTVEKRNFLSQRSPDPYEFSNPAESFAVNTEYFFTDLEYKCRRPLSYEYLSKKLNHEPFKDFRCNNTNKFPIATKMQIIWEEIDFNQLYEVHYLKAEKGNSIISGFGHSMIRLILCDPARKEKSKECLKDLSHHIVLSYRANITDVLISYLGGLTGKYPSQLFVMRFLDVIEEYNEVELRDLLSYPLNLNPVELQRVFNLMLAETYSYQGKYKFLTQNCATETMDFFRMISDNKEILDVRVTTPSHVNEELDDLKIIDELELEKKLENNERGYFFKSKKNVYEKVFNGLYDLLDYDDLDEFIEDSTAEERIELFRENKDQKDAKVLASRFYVLEKLIEKIQFKKMTEEVTKKASSEKGKLKESIKKIIDTNSSKSFTEKSGYGIPSYNELSIQLAKEEKLKSEKSNNVQVLKEWLIENFYDFKVEQEKRLHNIDELMLFIKEN